MNYEYIGRCADLTGKEIWALRDASSQVSDAEFYAHITPDQLAAARDSGAQLPLEEDWAISPMRYFVSELRGRLAYYLTWSGYEYVWLRA